MKYVIHIHTIKTLLNNFLNFSIFWCGGLHRVPSLTYHGNVFNVITGLLARKTFLKHSKISEKNILFNIVQNVQLSDPTSSLPSPPTSMTSPSLTSFGFTQEQVRDNLSMNYSFYFVNYSHSLLNVIHYQLQSEQVRDNLSMNYESSHTCIIILSKGPTSSFRKRKLPQ